MVELFEWDRVIDALIAVSAAVGIEVKVFFASSVARTPRRSLSWTPVPAKAGGSSFRAHTRRSHHHTLHFTGKHLVEYVGLEASLGGRTPGIEAQCCEHPGALE